ncbi:MAG: carboxypeptidase-like regulatory domain-containing protein [Acidobacteriota bacterium]
MGTEQRFRRLVICISWIVLVAAPATAQEEVGSLFGTVTDVEGGLLPGATVTLTGFGELRVQTADERGRFRFLGLAPGVWSLEARLDGFSTVHYPTIQIEASRSTTLVIEMSAAIEAAITVTAESPLLDERKLVTGTTLRQVELDKLPMARNPWAVLAQAPGVLISRVDVGDAESDQQAGFRAPGVSDTENDYVLEGTQIADNSTDQANMSPPTTSSINSRSSRW